MAEQESQDRPKSKTGKARRRDPWRTIKDHLSGQAPETLIELLLEVAQRDDQLYQSLLLKAERFGGDGNTFKAFRRAIKHATHIHGFIDWREVGTFARSIEQVVDSLAELLKADSAAMLVELAEYAIEQVESSMEQVDDSNGEIGSIVDRLGELHFKPCALAPPDPAGLA
ncbi:MAG: hypothetical protein SH820_07820 [Xanthomonadales bacterium]|nr:hypothetical protein [Xanthomonadales bacterium]